jgi:hypothetical protein
MSNDRKFSLLRKILRALGLSPEATEDLIQKVIELLPNRDEKPASADLFPYHLRDDFLTPAEHNFYLVLRQAVGDWALICPKVSLSDLFYAQSRDYGQFLTYTNKIDRKHVDFLLCDPQSVRPLLGIELDDKSHRRKDRRKRDKFVEGVFDAAGLPLARLSVQYTYNTHELTTLLQQHAGLNTSQTEDTTSTAVQDPPEPSAPACPKCGSEMVLRTARRGPNKGETFWGCSNYPGCRGIRKCDQISLECPSGHH